MLFHPRFYYCPLHCRESYFGGALKLVKAKGEPLHSAHCTRTARVLDQVPPKESPSTPLPNALISPPP